MGWVSGIAVYFIIWWLVIFAILPWGVRTLDSEDVVRGHAQSAPKRPRIGLKMAVTTVVAALLWLVVFAVVESDLISFRS